MRRGDGEGLAISGKINLDLVVVTDEYLDRQAERFRFWRVLELLGISFARFLDDPDGYVGRAARRRAEAVRSPGWERAYA